tara:strand:+ start:243 stop:362 length:120 start_codon:yes stop_codon:yes gene_type:complete
METLIKTDCSQAETKGQKYRKSVEEIRASLEGVNFVYKK